MEKIPYPKDIVKADFTGEDFGHAQDGIRTRPRMFSFA